MKKIGGENISLNTLIYQMPDNKFNELNRSDRRVAFYFGLPLFIVILLLFIKMAINPKNVTRTYIISVEIFLASCVFLLIYFGGLGRAIKHKILKIYNNGIVPTIIPFRELTLKDVFISYNKITKIIVETHLNFDDLYVFHLFHENGRVYRIDSKWLFQYKLSTKEIHKIKDILLKIKDELEKTENKTKRINGEEIRLTLSN